MVKNLFVDDVNLQNFLKSMLCQQYTGQTLCAKQHTGLTLFVIVSRLDKPDFASVVLRAHGEVEPVDASAVALKQQFVEVLLGLVADVEQDGGVAEELFLPCHPDVGSAAGQVVRCGYAAHGLVHLCRAVAAVDDQRVVALPIHHVPARTQLL